VKVIRALVALGALAMVPTALAQDSTADAIAAYRAALQDGNPAELWEIRGADLWRQKRGPKQVSLEACDLGLGAGVVKGAYARLPRYFPDADRVLDLEARLLWCMVRLQGYTEADARRNPFGEGSARKSDLEALAAYVSSESRGVAMDVALSHPKEAEAYRAGEALFFFRAGTHDFACATCHSEQGKRIRLQDLPDLATVDGARKAYTTWPAYRVSQGELRTFEWRLYDCFRQQRFPELVLASDAAIALTMYLARNANGAPFAAPAIKR
jgi:sulfur-oxidizing protein SoxA